MTKEFKTKMKTKQNKTKRARQGNYQDLKIGRVPTQPNKTSHLTPSKEVN
jgi:hypothetical protein